MKSRSSDTLPPYRILDRSGRRFGWVEMLRTWMFSDRIQATLRVPGRADWPFEGILHASPASLGKVLRSASERNLRHLLASPHHNPDRLARGEKRSGEMAKSIRF